MKAIEKNLLDLQRSLSQTKGSLFFSVGIGSGVAIFFGGKQLGIPPLTSFIIAELFSFLFILRSIQHFTKCGLIQKQIEEYLTSKKL